LTGRPLQYLLNCKVFVLINVLWPPALANGDKLYLQDNVLCGSMQLTAEEIPKLESVLFYVHSFIYKIVI